MYDYIATKDGCIGFGETREDADYDLYLNLCRKDFSYDKGEFLRRREQLKPWLPKPNMLHLAGIGCLVYERSMLTNTKTGKSVYIDMKEYSICYHLAALLGDALSYTDIFIVIRPELDKFCHNMSRDFKKLQTFPEIQLLGRNNGFAPSILYTFECGLVVGITDTMVGIRTIHDELFHVAATEDGLFLIPLLSYIASRLGYVFSKEGVYKYGEEVKVF